MADSDGDSDEARVIRPLQAAACTYRIAFGPRASQKALIEAKAPLARDLTNQRVRKGGEIDEARARRIAAGPGCAPGWSTSSRWSSGCGA